jgi:hypothetical protein
MDMGMAITAGMAIAVITMDGLSAAETGDTITDELRLKPVMKSRRANRRLFCGMPIYFLRLSFMRSPGENSDAPFDWPTVPLSCIRSPGLSSDAPGPVLVFEFCISWPGLD